LPSPERLRNRVATALNCKARSLKAHKVKADAADVVGGGAAAVRAKASRSVPMTSTLRVWRPAMPMTMATMRSTRTRRTTRARKRK